MSQMRRTVQTTLRRAAFGLLAGVVIYVTPLQWASEALSRAFGFPEGFENLAPLPDTELAALRGGMLLPNGMVLNFRVEFKTVIDGVVENHQFFDTADLENSNIPADFFENGGIINNLVVNSNGQVLEAGAADSPAGFINGIMTQVMNDANGLNIEHSTSFSATLENAGGLAQTTRPSITADQIRSGALMSLR